MTHDTSTGVSLEDQFNDWFADHVGEAEFDPKQVVSGSNGFEYLIEGEDGVTKVEIPDIYFSLMKKYEKVN